MPGKLSYDEVKFWQNEITSCIARQDKELKTRNHYPLMIEYYEGNQRPDDKFKTSQQRLVFLNEYFPNTNQILNEIIYQYPEFMATPTRPTNSEVIDPATGEKMTEEQQASIMKSAITYGMKHLDAVTEMRLAAFDMIYAGYAGVEINHINTFGTQTYIPEKPQQSFFGKVVDIAKQAVGIEKAELTLEQEAEPKEMSYATTDETYLRRWNPLDILLDYRAERLKDSRYIIKRIKMSKAEFKAKYPEFGDKIQTGGILEYSTHEDENYKNAVILYEIQVKKKDNVYDNIVICPSYTLAEIDFFTRPYKTNGFNLKIGTLHEYGKLYPISMAKINKAMQDDINNYATFMMEVAERNIPKRGYNINKVKEPALSALNSTKVNEAVGIEGGAEAVWSLPASNVSVENKELLGMFQSQKEKLWAIPQQRLGISGGEKFATELNIQNAGFEAATQGIQQGVKKLWLEVADGLKDIIVTFWDKEYFFKITGSDKPTWYEPETRIDPMTGETTILNPLTDILTADYEIDLDIVSASRPNKEKKKVELVEFAKWILSPDVQMFLQMQGYKLNIDVIKKTAQEWGWNPSNLIQPVTPEEQLGNSLQMSGLPGAGQAPANNALPVLPGRA